MMSRYKNFTKKLSDLFVKDKDKTKSKFKRFLFGMKFTDGFFYKVTIYLMLFGLGYIYLYPLMYMISYSFMTMTDIIDVSVNWIPTKFTLENYRIVWEAIDYPKAFLDAVILAGLPALSATFSSALIGYGFAKYDFPFKKTLMALMILTFIIPPQVTMMPTFRMYARYDLLGTIKTFIYPAILGQGFNGAIYILIFYSFFRMIPKSLMESAQLDGAGPLKIFTKIAIPLAVPAIIIVFLFSFVWYYNETYLSGLFLRDSDMLTLPLRIGRFIDGYAGLYPPGSLASQLMQSAKLAGNILTILPLLILFFFTQKYFVEAIDKTGITGE